MSPMFEDHLYFKFLNTFSNRLTFQKLEEIGKMLFITVSEQLVTFAINSNINSNCKIVTLNTVSSSRAAGTLAY